MANASDEVKEQHREPNPVPPSVPPLRSVWNWFGAVFGIVVLLGVGGIYVTGRPASTVARPAATEPVAADQTHAEPAPGGTGATGAVGADSAPAVTESDAGQPTGGRADGTRGGSEVIEIEMVEFGYVPERISLRAGVPVVLRFSNTGRLVHEAMVGDAHMQEEFAAAGGHDDVPSGDDHHGDLMAVTVQPGETMDLEVVIDEPGEWFAACHLPGHYEQGQVATIEVKA